MTTRHTTAIIVLLLIAAIAGILLGVRLPSSIFPDVTFPLIKVIADVGEQPSSTMIPTVTRPIEEAILRVPGIETVRSTTSRGSTELSAQFSWGTDIQLAMQRVEAEIQRVRPDLPSEAHVDIERMNTAIFPILGYALTSETHSQADLRQLAEFTLKPELIRIQGVSQVQIQGGREREFQVVLDDRELAGRKLTASDVVDAIQANNQVLSAGLLQANKELYPHPRRRQRPWNPADRDHPGPRSRQHGAHHGRRPRDGSLHRRCFLDPHHRRGQAGRPGQPDPATFASTLAIAKGVASLLHDKPDLLPPDVKWTTFYDQARFVSDSVNGVRDAILIGSCSPVWSFWCSSATGG